jgi:hypothetical protein
MDEQLLLIRLADDEESRAGIGNMQHLLVKASLMRSCSTVAEGLPAEAAEWDLGNLLIDGQPVHRSTVIRWLNMCCMNIHHRLFQPVA